MSSKDYTIDPAFGDDMLDPGNNYIGKVRRDEVNDALRYAKEIESYLGKFEDGELFDNARFIREILEKLIGL